jgi:hypothetical protein
VDLPPHSLILRSIAQQCVSKDEASPEGTGPSFETPLARLLRMRAMSWLSL